MSLTTSAKDFPHHKRHRLPVAPHQKTSRPLHHTTITPLPPTHHRTTRMFDDDNSFSDADGLCSNCPRPKSRGTSLRSQVRTALACRFPYRCSTQFEPAHRTSHKSQKHARYIHIYRYMPRLPPLVLDLNIYIYVYGSVTAEGGRRSIGTDVISVDTRLIWLNPSMGRIPCSSPNISHICSDRAQDWWKQSYLRLDTIN